MVTFLIIYVIDLGRVSEYNFSLLLEDLNLNNYSMILFNN